MKAVRRVNIVLENMTHQQLEMQTIDALLRLLQTVPVLSNVDVSVNRSHNYDIEAYAEISTGGELCIICNVMDKGEPRFIRKAVNRLLEQKHRMERESKGEHYCLIGAPYISPEAGGICEELGVGYIDLSGNCLLVHKSIYIRVEGKPNRYKEGRSSKSIFERNAVKSSIILRNILERPEKKWKTQELADVSGVSLGQVAKVKKFLEEREFIVSKASGFAVQRIGDIIEKWAKVYNKKPNTVYECYSLQSIPQVEQRLADMEKELDIEYALTSFAGGVRYAPAVRYNKIHVYISHHEIQEAIQFLDIKKVESGANVSIIVPYDQCVLLHKKEKNGSSVVSPLQACLDLMGLRGRGEEAAAAIIAKEFGL